jgi:hypothetical protein
MSCSADDDDDDHHHHYHHHLNHEVINMIDQHKASFRTLL